MSDTVKTYRDLVVWQKACRLSIRVYEVTRRFPRDERFGLTSQLRRAAVSIPSNIAEQLPLSDLRGGASEVARMLKALIRSMKAKET